MYVYVYLYTYKDKHVHTHVIFLCNEGQSNNFFLFKRIYLLMITKQISGRSKIKAFRLLVMYGLSSKLYSDGTDDISISGY